VNTPKKGVKSAPEAPGQEAEADRSFRVITYVPPDDFPLLPGESR
jgi:hypothetical protein